MSLRDLRPLLDAERISPTAYSLGSGDLGDRYYIERVDQGWSVHYLERGIKRRQRLFEQEDSACRYFLELVISDPTTRLPDDRASLE